MRNNATGSITGDPLIVVVKFKSEGETTTHQIFPMDDFEVNFTIKTAPTARGAASFVIEKQKSKKNTTTEVIQAEMALGLKDICVMIGGTYKTPSVQYIACE